MKRVILAGALIIGISCSSRPRQPAAELASRVHALDIEKPYQVADYAFLKDAVGARSIVQLGESIHVTSEFPRARLRLIQYLHELMGFDVLAFEGSLIDTWLAQEYIYRSKEPVRQTAAQAMKIGLFGLWQTDSMREVLEYIVQTQSTPSPLYLTDFDIQPGMSRANRGPTAALGAFLAALHEYDPTESSSEIEKWTSALGPALNCDAMPPPQSSLDALQEWIVKTAGIVAAQRPEAHAAALRLAPGYFKMRIAHCQEVRDAGGSRRTYQEARDRFNAINALALRDQVSKSHRIILWAHHSHVNHNSAGRNVPSMGQHLLAAAPDSLYTIGVFAGGGRALDALKLDAPGIFGFFPKQLSSDTAIEKSLARVQGGDFFVDFAAPGKLPDDWLRLSTGRAETSIRIPLTLARDFHAAIFIENVHPAALRIFPPWLSLLLRIGGFILQPFVLGVLTVVLVSLVARLVLRVRRSRAAQAG